MATREARPSYRKRAADATTIADQRSAICGCTRHAVAITRAGLNGWYLFKCDAEECASVRIHLSGESKERWCFQGFVPRGAGGVVLGRRDGRAMLDRRSLQSLVATFAIDPQIAQ